MTQMYTTIQKSGVSKFYFEEKKRSEIKKVVLLFSKDALHWIKLVKTDVKYAYNVPNNEYYFFWTFFPL